MRGGGGATHLDKGGGTAVALPLGGPVSGRRTEGLAAGGRASAASRSAVATGPSDCLIVTLALGTTTGVAICMHTTPVNDSNYGFAKWFALQGYCVKDGTQLSTSHWLPFQRYRRC